MPRKAQQPSYAAPVIIAATAILFLFYLIMLYPWERAALLGVPGNQTNESPLGPGTEILYSSGELVEVGSGMAGVVSFFPLQDFLVSYPAVPVVVDSSGVGQISANVITSDTILLNANDINKENVQGLLLKLNITGVEGLPKLVVILNQSTVYTNVVEPGELEIRMPVSILQEDNDVYVKLYHTGWFWEVQKVNFQSVVLNRVEYQANTPSQTQIVPLSASNLQGNTLRITFNATEATTDGNLVLKVNGQEVWSGRPAAGIVSEASVNLDQSNLRVSNNDITFEAERGGDYSLDNVTMFFVAEAAPPAKKVYSFDIPSSKLFAGKPIKVGVRIDRVIEPGTLQVRIVPFDTTYFFTKQQLNPGVWVYTNVDKTRLKELGNQIEVNSADGRFRISGFMVILG
jgi:hypothetical protein